MHHQLTGSIYRWQVRIYCKVQKVHQSASPIDKLHLLALWSSIIGYATMQGIAEKY